MVKHIVLFKFNENVSSEDKKEKMKQLEDVLLGLKPKIQVLKEMKVFIKASEAPESAYDLMISTEFESFKDLDAYRVHPDHLKVVDYVNSLNLQRAAMDFHI